MTTFHELCVEIQKVLACGGPLDDEQDAAYEIMDLLERHGIIPDNDGRGDDEVFGDVPDGLIEQLRADADEWERLAHIDTFADTDFGRSCLIRAANARAAAANLELDAQTMEVLGPMDGRSILVLRGVDEEQLDAMAQAVRDQFVAVLENEGHVGSIAGKVPLIVALGGGQEIEVLDEEEMRRAGWVRFSGDFEGEPDSAADS